MGDRRGVGGDPGITKPAGSGIRSSGGSLGGDCVTVAIVGIVERTGDGADAGAEADGTQTNGGACTRTRFGLGSAGGSGSGVGGTVSSPATALGEGLSAVATVEAPAPARLSSASAAGALIAALVFASCLILPCPFAAPSSLGASGWARFRLRLRRPGLDVASPPTPAPAPAPTPAPSVLLSSSIGTTTLSSTCDRAFFLPAGAGGASALVSAGFTATAFLSGRKAIGAG